MADELTIIDTHRVEPRVTDSVTQTNTKILGDAPSMSMGTTYQHLAHSTGLGWQNAVSTQHLADITAAAATTIGVQSMYLVDTLGDSLAGSKLDESDEGEYMASLLAVVQAFAPK